MRCFHVTSSRNRDSILQNGLDWTFMGVARGIAGSTEPEQPGVFLCRDEFEADWFVQMNNTSGSVDVWLVVEVDGSDLVESPEGFLFLPAAIPTTQIELVRRDA